ncbi:uncharacterized protein LOC134818239 isoform X1 [Bolinopsis microptera]|uniref:uncharacterized protein LOC134818239 isoform X1 n=1 Tax=Bolinopsis microptera TaxID=2820187 RepID=UPI00307AB5A4
MDVILLTVEFGSHRIRSSRVLYSVIVKCVSSSNQIKKVEVCHCVDEFTKLKDHIEHHSKFPDLGITFKPFLQTSFWQSEKDPKVISQRSKEFSEFLTQIQKSIFLLTISSVKFFCQGLILDYNSGSKKKRRVTIACCQRSKSKCFEFDCAVDNQFRYREPESFVAVSSSDLHPFYKEYNQVKHQLKVAGGKYSREDIRKKFEVPELLVLSDEDLTLLLERNNSFERFPSSECTGSTLKYTSLSSSETS